MPSLFNQTDRAAIETRIRRLPVGATAAWGKFSSEQMLTHVTDGLRMALGDLPIGTRVKGAPKVLSWPPVRHAIIHWLPFPKGAPTAPELLTRVAVSHHDELKTLLTWIERAAANESHGEWAPHPAFGVLSTKKWGALMHKHRPPSPAVQSLTI